MRAIVCRQWAGPEALAFEDFPDPAASEDEVTIDVRACSVNHADLLMIRGAYQTRPPLPFVPGLDAAGTIASAPPGSGLAAGDRVAAILWHGGYAERTRASVGETFRLPPTMPFDVAAALSSTYLSTTLALEEVGRLCASETLLVLGAGGGVGLAAVQLGKALGARVIAVAGSPEKLAAAADAGADEAVSHASGAWKDEVARLAGPEGVRVCLDPVGGAFFDSALSTVGWGGRYVVVGFAAGQIPNVAANRLLVKHRALLGSSLRYFRRYDPAALRRAMAGLFARHAAGALRPRIAERRPLRETPEALRALAERRVIGKLIVTNADGS
ncbi:MAG: NADPH:quinone oxidoreductase family protein [Polyangiaceae bacterium]|jgi:NADPH2:quinone reductase|nr:NADPH:quinone oxidoreductase family protein [Polyangiaceae bacterium]